MPGTQDGGHQPPGGHAPHVAVVIPAYQAERTIAEVVRSVPDLVRTILVVDDASRDATGERARSVGDGRVVVLRHDSNQGVGGAVLTGYREAMARGADVVVKVDADGQMAMEELPRLLEPVLAGRADYAKGNRFSTGSHLTGMPWIRLVGNAGLSFLVKLCSGAWHVFDPTNGYTAIHARALSAVDLRRVHRRYFFESSMLVALNVARAVIEDVPMPARYGDAGSHLSVRRALVDFPPSLARAGAWRFVKMYLVHDFNACSVLVLLGLPCLVFGFADGLYVWAKAARTGHLTPTGTVMIPTLMTIVGFQMLLHALMLDVGNAAKRPLQSSPAPIGSRPATSGTEGTA